MHWRNGFGGIKDAVVVSPGGLRRFIYISGQGKTSYPIFFVLQLHLECYMRALAPSQHYPLSLPLVLSELVAEPTAANHSPITPIRPQERGWLRTHNTQHSTVASKMANPVFDINYPTPGNQSNDRLTALHGCTLHISYNAGNHTRERQVCGQSISWEARRRCCYRWVPAASNPDVA